MVLKSHGSKNYVLAGAILRPSPFELHVYGHALLFLKDYMQKHPTIYSPQLKLWCVCDIVCAAGDGGVESMHDASWAREHPKWSVAVLYYNEQIVTFVDIVSREQGYAI